MDPLYKTLDKMLEDDNFKRCHSAYNFLRFVINYSKKSGFCQLTNEQISNKLNISTRQVTRNIEKCLKHGYISRTWIKCGDRIERKSIVVTPVEEVEFVAAKNQEYLTRITLQK